MSSPVMKSSIVTKFLLVIPFVFGIVVSPLLAQDIDNLLGQLQKANDLTEKVVVNNAIGNKLRYAYPDSALFFFNNSKNYAIELNDMSMLCVSYNSIASVWVIKRKYDSAIYNINRCIDIALKNEQYGNLSRGYNTMGLIEVGQSMNRQAVLTFNKALSYGSVVSGNNLESKIYNNLGLAFKRLHIYDSSLFYYQKSLKIKEEINDKKGIASTTNNIALIYEKLGDLDLTYKYLTRSLLIRQQHKNRYGEAIVLNNFGLFYERQGQFEEALNYYERSLDVMMELNRKSRIATLYNNIGSVHASMKNFKQAHKYLIKALKLNRELDNKRGQLFSLLDLAVFFKDLRIYTNATNYYHQGLSLSMAIENLDMVSENYDGLYTCFEEMKQFDSALYYHKKYIYIKDSIFNSSSKRNIEKLEIEYESLKKEKENEDLLRENQISSAKLRQQYLVAILLAAFLFFVILLALLILRNRNYQKLSNVQLIKQKHEIEIQTEKLKQAYGQLKKMAEFKDEMSGMIVHDLKNPINTIINIADLSTENREHANLIKFSAKHMLNLVMNVMDVYRYESASMQLNKTSAELRYVIKKAYEEVKFNLELKGIQFIAPEAMDYLVNIDVAVFERVFINLFTNAIKFSGDDPKIEIFFETLLNKRLKIHVKDNGTGIDPKMAQKIFEKYGQAEKRNFGLTGSNGLGLAYCKLALAAHDGEIGVESKLGEGADFFLIVNYDEPIYLALEGKERHTYVEHDLELQQSEVATLKPYVAPLRDLRVYQVSEIRQALNGVQDMPISNIRQFYKVLMETVMACNESKYEKLVDLIVFPDRE